MINICEYCGEEFNACIDTQKFCSWNCRNLNKIKEANKKWLNKSVRDNIDPSRNYKLGRHNITFTEKLNRRGEYGYR